MSASGRQDDVRSEHAFESLFAHAEARPQASLPIESAVRREVRAAWLDAVAARRRKRLGTAALAASLLIALAIPLSILAPFPWLVAGPVMAGIDKQFGDVRIVDASGMRYDNANSNFPISPGLTITTGAGSGLAVTWSNGGSLRIDQQTEVSVASVNEIDLHGGQVYFDSAPVTTGPAAVTGADTGVLRIDTDNGVVTPLGTRYATRERDGELRVLVREGRVSVEGPAYAATAAAGEQLTVAGDGAPAVDPVATAGDDWQWIEKTTPAWDTEGKTIFEFLDWVSRETGRSFRFATPSAERLARSASLVGYGRVDLEPSVALRIVLLATDLDWSVENGVIVVTEKPQPGATGAM